MDKRRWGDKFCSAELQGQCIMQCQQIMQQRMDMMQSMVKRQFILVEKNHMN